MCCAKKATEARVLTYAGVLAKRRLPLMANGFAGTAKFFLLLGAVSKPFLSFDFLALRANQRM